MRAFECFYRLGDENGPGRTALILVNDSEPNFLERITSLICEVHQCPSELIKDFDYIFINNSAMFYRLP